MPPDLKDQLYRRNFVARKIKDTIFNIAVWLFSLATIIPLILILGYIFKGGLSVLNLKFLFSLPKPPGEPGGGIASALVGTIILVLIASIIAIPIGVWAGIYLAEKKDTALAKAASLVIDVLQSTPSIVIGIIVYLWIVVPMKSFSALSGGVALAIMMLPVVAKTTEETVKMVPDYLKEAAYALGASYPTVVTKVILPTSMNGIITGILVATARIAGETAPLLFTAFGNPFLNLNILKPVDALPLLIFNYATSPYEDWHAIAWGASTVLVIMILLLNLIVRVLTSKSSREV